MSRHVAQIRAHDSAGRGVHLALADRKAASAGEHHRPTPIGGSFHRPRAPTICESFARGVWPARWAHFEFLEGAANQSRRHEKANIPASMPQRSQVSQKGPYPYAGTVSLTLEFHGGSGDGSQEVATMSPIIALASNPKTHIAIVRTMVLCRASPTLSSAALCAAALLDNSHQGAQPSHVLLFKPLIDGNLGDRLLP